MLNEREIKRRRNPRDWQRKKVYDAEAKLIEQMARLDTVQECQLIVDRIVASKWWQDTYPQGVVRVCDGRGCRRAFATHHDITLPRAHRDVITICHELAHVINLRRQWRGLYLPAHGITFCATYLDLVRRVAGSKLEEELRQHFLDGGVKFRGRERFLG